MLLEKHLKDLISNDELGSPDKLLLCLAVDDNSVKSVKNVTDLAFRNGFRRAKRLNVSDCLRRSKGLAVRVDNGWILSNSGLAHVQQIAGPLMGSLAPKVASSLRTEHARILDADTRAFVEEAITCFESRRYRAAIVLSWVGAMAVLQHHVVRTRLADFNSEATRRDANWKTARTPDDIGLMKEDTFLDILQTISVLGKNVKQELKKGLVLRNGCGHPNSLRVAEHKAAAHIEDLMLNVYARF